MHVIYKLYNILRTDNTQITEPLVHCSGANYKSAATLRKENIKKTHHLNVFSVIIIILLFNNRKIMQNKRTTMIDRCNRNGSRTYVKPQVDQEITCTSTRDG